MNCLFVCAFTLLNIREVSKMNMKQKITSRKLWAAVAGVVTGLAMVFGLDETVISTVAGAIVSVMSVVTYIVTEGKVDAERIKNTIEDIQESIKAVEGSGLTIVKSTTIYDSNQVDDSAVSTEISIDSE